LLASDCKKEGAMYLYGKQNWLLNQKPEHFILLGGLSVGIKIKTKWKIQTK